MAGHDSGRGAFNNCLRRWHGPLRVRLHPEHTREPALDSDGLTFDVLTQSGQRSRARSSDAVFARLTQAPYPAVFTGPPTPANASYSRCEFSGSRTHNV